MAAFLAGAMLTMALSDYAHREWTVSSWSVLILGAINLISWLAF